MISLKEAFISKHNLDKIKINKFGLTEKDLIGELKGFPIGVVMRILEEQEMQGNMPNVKIFQKRIRTPKTLGGFSWRDTEAKHSFWNDVINFKNFDGFYEKYPKYKEYDK